MRFTNKGPTSFAQYSSGIVVPLLVLAVGFAAYFLLLPKYKDLKSARQEAQGKKAVTEQQRQQLASINALLEDLEKKKDDLASIDEALPVVPRIPELLANLEEVSKRSGILITGLQIIPAPTAGTAAGLEVSRIKRTQAILSLTEGLNVMQIDLNLKGKYPNMLSLLANLEQNLRLMDVQAISLDQVDVESGAQDFSLQIQTYYQTE